MITSKNIFIFVSIVALLLLAAVFFSHQNRSPEAAKTLPATETPSVSTQTNRPPVASVIAASPALMRSIQPPTHSMAGSGVTTTPDTESQPHDNGTGTNSSGGLQFAAGPPNGMAVVQFSVKRLLNRTPEIMQHNVGPVSPDSLVILPPLAVYDLDTSAIANGGGLEAARPNGRYLYLIESSGRFVITVAMVVDDSGNGTPVSWGDDARGPGMTAGLQQLATLDEISAKVLNVRGV
jgi:hypothetical protein